MKNYINNGKYLNKKPIYLNIKYKKIAFCSNLPCGLLFFSGYKLLRTKSKKNSQYFKTITNATFLGFLKQLKENSKLKSDDTENELLKYIELNIAKLIYIYIKNYKNNLEPLKELRKIRITQRTRNK